MEQIGLCKIIEISSNAKSQRTVIDVICNLFLLYEHQSELLVWHTIKMIENDM